MKGHRSTVCVVQGDQTQPIFTTCTFCTCELYYSVKSICNTKVNSHGAFIVICRHVLSREKFFAQQKLSKVTLPSWFTSHTVTGYCFHDLFSTMIFTFGGFSLVISLFKMFPMQRAEVLGCLSTRMPSCGL